MVDHRLTNGLLNHPIDCWRYFGPAIAPCTEQPARLEYSLHLSKETGQIEPVECLYDRDEIECATRQIDRFGGLNTVVNPFVWHGMSELGCTQIGGRYPRKPLRQRHLRLAVPRGTIPGPVVAR